MSGFAIDLAQEVPKPATFLLEGDEEHPLRVTFKKRLTRQERMTMTRSVGKGKKKRDVADVEAILRRTVKSVEGVSIDGGKSYEEKIEDIDLIIKIFGHHQMSAVADALETYILEGVDLGEIEKKD